MMGVYTVDLASRIQAARKRYNDTLLIQGASHPSTQSALLKYRQLRQDAKALLSDSTFR
jgi:hypothetical protein